VNGHLTKKQNVFDDFAGAATHLIERGFTSRERLAAEGGSNGGLLMGAMITQYPGLFRAVVSHGGIYDMLRVELTPNGEFNTTEYGTVKDRDQFAALYEYSPYHLVQDKTAYPSVLFLTGANDPRVDPMHSRKMTARLQAATSAANPILLRTSATTGHGGGSPLSAESSEEADVYVFLFQELGLQYRADATASNGGAAKP
jgi:prolyl oligopeptidase